MKNTQFTNFLPYFGKLFPLPELLRLLLVSDVDEDWDIHDHNSDTINFWTSNCVLKSWKTASKLTHIFYYNLDNCKITKIKLKQLSLVPVIDAGHGAMWSKVECCVQTANRKSPNLLMSSSFIFPIIL